MNKYGISTVGNNLFRIGSSSSAAVAAAAAATKTAFRKKG